MIRIRKSHKATGAETRATAKYLGRSRVSANKQVAKELVRTKKKLRTIGGALRAELRFNDPVLSGSVTATGITPQLINGLIVGDNPGTREGRMIQMKSLYFNFGIYHNVTSTPSFVRIFVIYDKMALGVPPTYTEYLLTVSPFAVRQWDFLSRFTVLYDKTFTVDTTRNINRRVRINLRNKKTYYNAGNLGTVADIDKGSLYIMAISDQAANFPTLDLRSRLTYYP